MLTTLINFFCSRAFHSQERGWTYWSKWLVAIAMGGLVAGLYACFAGDWALPGANSVDLAKFTGAGVYSREGNFLLQAIVSCTNGSMLALNTLAAIFAGCVAVLTCRIVNFWVLDNIEHDSVLNYRSLIAIATSVLSCVILATTLTFWYVGTSFTVALWNFGLLLLCIVLQNSYAMSGGKFWRMCVFGAVMGFVVFESSWVLMLLPLFFVRIIMIEWRLWDHSVKHLPCWFIFFALALVAYVVLNPLRLGLALTMGNVWQVVLADLVGQAVFFKTLLSEAWMIELVLGLGWIILGWLTARRLMNNDRSWGLLFTAIALALVGFAVLGMMRLTPMRIALQSGLFPIATAWGIAIVLAFFGVGWGIQLFARNPNFYEDTDRRKVPACVSALRLAGLFFFPGTLFVIVVSGVWQTRRFVSIDRGMVNRFAAETVDALAPTSTSAAAHHPYLVSDPWLDNHLLLVAHAKQIPMTLLAPGRMTDPIYLADLKQRIEKDPLLGDADRVRLTHLLDYNFLVFIQDFFVSQQNASEIAAAYALADVWYAAKLRPAAYGTIYLGVPENGNLPVDPLPEMQALQARWKTVLEVEGLPWWDINGRAQLEIRHHMAFMANNLGTLLDDMQRTEDAATCYDYAFATDKNNISALLNLYDVSVRRGQLDSRRVAIIKAFDEFIRERTKASRKYDLSAVGRYFGYIRNYDLFVQMGWEWAISAAPESVLAGLRNAQNGLAPSDPRNGAVQSVLAAVYEMQGETSRSADSYQAAVAANPNNVAALRGLARIAIQSGKVNDAGKWLAKAEEVKDAEDDLDLDRTAYLMAMGDLEGARRAISRYTTKHNQSAAGWAMLGVLEVEQGNLERASGYILENIRRSSDVQDRYFTHILQGRIAQARNQWEAARNHFRRAYGLRPNLHALLAVLLEFDRQLGDKVTAEVDALALLRYDATHPYANYIVGAQRLEDGYVTEAVRYFNAALNNEAEPSTDLLNNAADALARTASKERAVTLATRAVQSAANRFDVWGTLAFALARSGDTIRAKTALKKSRELEGGDNPRLGMVDFWIAWMEKDREAAGQALEDFKIAVGEQLTPMEKKDVAEAEALLNEATPEQTSVND